MKKYLALLISLLLVIPTVYASSIEVQDDGTYVGTAVKLNFTGVTTTFSQDTATIPIAGGASIVREIQFPLSFLHGVDGSQLSTTSVPGLAINNSLASVVWSDGETSAAQVTFKVPADYSSGGAFYLLCDESANSTRSQVDFEVYVNTDGAVWDSAVTGQTPVALTEVAGTAEQVSLTVATDFSALAAGTYVSLNVWRDDTAVGTNDLELYYASFYYTANE